jgi:hypothetical protein
MTDLYDLIDPSRIPAAGHKADEALLARLESHAGKSFIRHCARRLCAIVVANAEPNRGNTDARIERVRSTYDRAEVLFADLNDQLLASRILIAAQQELSSQGWPPVIDPKAQPELDKAVAREVEHLKTALLRQGHLLADEPQGPEPKKEPAKDDVRRNAYGMPTEIASRLDALMRKKDTLDPLVYKCARMAIKCGVDKPVEFVQTYVRFDGLTCVQAAQKTIEDNLTRNYQVNPVASVEEAVREINDPDYYERITKWWATYTAGQQQVREFLKRNGA